MALRSILDKVTAVEARIHTTDGDGPAKGRAWDGCPYLGLAPFEERHADVFYGRKELTTHLEIRDWLASEYSSKATDDGTTASSDLL
jgi:hypothetical protein